MSFIAQLENKEFKDFLDTFNSVYSNPKEGKEAIEAEKTIWEAVEKLSSLLSEEVSKIAKHLDEGSDIGKLEKPYITLVRENPALLYCVLDSFFGKELGFFNFKKEMPPDGLNAKKLCCSLLHFLMGTQADQIKKTFIVFPEFQRDATILFACTESSVFPGLFKHYQLINLNLPSNFGKHDKAWFHQLYLHIQRSGGCPVPPDDYTRAALQKTGSCNLNDWSKQLEHCVSLTKILSPEQEQQLLFKTIETVSIRCRQSGEHGASHAEAQNLFFLMNGRIPLKSSERPEEQWFRHIPWDNLRDHHLFLFDHVEPEKAKILEYWDQQYPDLVRIHLTQGNFFIANLLIELGLVEPEIEPDNFLAESVRLGLMSSKEVKKFHAYFLLQLNIGLVDPKEIILLKDLLNRDNTETIKKIVESNLLAMSKHYIKIHHEDLVIQKNTFKALNKVMLALYKDYSIALSTIYGLPIFKSDHVTKLYRGVTIPKTRFNLQFAEHWIHFGHKATYYSMWGHGYNRGVDAQLEEGPTMPWAGNSDTTRTATQLAGNYLHSDNEADAFLISLQFQPGEPVFFGNLCPPPKKFPYEIELPMCFAQNLEGVYHFDNSQNVINAFYQMGVNPQNASLIQGESIGTGLSDRATKVVTPHMTNLEEALKENPLEFESEFSDYLQKYDASRMRLTFDNNLASFGSLSTRMSEIRRHFKDATPLKYDNLINHILEFSGCKFMVRPLEDQRLDSISVSAANKANENAKMVVKGL